jgi:hypothetical protein
MPNPVLTPWSKLIPLIPVPDHTERIDSAFWEKYFRIYGLNKCHAVIFGGCKSAEISRHRLMSYKYHDDVQKCLEIFLWGYPKGGRGNISDMFLKNIEKIARCAPVALPWNDYFDELHSIGNLGISTISKLAYFYGHQFGGYHSLILDSRLIKVLAEGRWSGLSMSHLTYTNAAVQYPSYLALLAGVATQLGCPEDHIEFLLFAWGESF